jgi:hypothetical protein
MLEEGLTRYFAQPSRTGENSSRHCAPGGWKSAANPQHSNLPYALVFSLKVTTPTVRKVIQGIST